MADFLGLSADELRLFLDETGEHLDTLETELLALEQGGPDPERVARVFRAAHTIKGAAATVGLEGMAHLTHAMETLLDRVRSGSLAATPPVMPPLLAGVDVLRQMLAAVVARELPQAAPPDLVADLVRAAAEEADGVPAPGAGRAAPAADRAVAGAGGGPAGSAVVRVELDPVCPMPAVRALQVLLALEGLGQVLASEPSQERIEAEQVSGWLTVWLESSRDPAAIRAALGRVPDLAGVEVVPGDAAAETGAALAEETAPGPVGPSTEAAGPLAPGARRNGPPAPRGEDRTIRVDVALLDDLMNLVGELVIDRGRLAGIGHTLAQQAGVHEVAEELNRVTGHLARVTGSLQEKVLKARMLPVERVFRKFPRLVRDLAQQLGRQVDFRVAGEDTELDRSLLEVIGDPLMHLVRNALDHGLESPEERVRAGKPAVGRLQLVAAHEENQVVILVQDDGRGIEPERVRAAAVRKGILTAERARELGEREAIQLLFAPGFSTAEQVTDVSGRGVGLDVVRRNIEGVGGRIDVESRPGAGTTFRLLLPLTLATIRALLVGVGRETLALPLSTIAETLRVAPGELSSVKGRWVTRVRGQVVPLLWLEQLLTPAFRPQRGTQPVLAVLVSHKGELVGLVVDRLVGEQEVVVKGLGTFFGQVKGVSGVTILGDGSLALIVDIGGLVRLLAAGNGDAAATGAPLTAAG